MAEKCIKERGKDGMDGLLAVVVNFESLRFMTLIKENYFISDLITEVEKTFTKLCSAKVTIKTLKNSVNAVLPNWYPVAPLIKNGDEIFAFSDAAADVLNINFSKPTNLNFSKYTPTDTKSSCGSTVPGTYDSGFGSRNEVGTVGTNMDKESGEEGTHKTNMDIQVESHTCPGLEKSCEHQNKLMEEDCENYSILSETFSLQKQYRNPVFENNQNTRDEMLGKNKDKNSGREEETRANQNDVLSAIVTKGEKLDKSKKSIAGKSDLPKSTSSAVNTIGDTSGVIDSGRLPIVQRSEVPVAAKLPEQGPKAKKNLTTVAAKSAESRKRSASSSSSDSDDSSDDSSWQSDVSVGGKKEDAKPVQKAVTAVATKRSKNAPQQSRTLREQVTNSGTVSGKKQKEPTDSSDIVEENISVDLNDSGNSSKNSNVKANEGAEEDSASSVDDEEMIEKPQAESETKESRREKDTANKSSSKPVQRSNNNAKTEPEKRTDKISKKTTAKTKTKSGQAVKNKSSSSDTSAAKLSDVSKAIKIKIQNRSKNSNVSRKPVGDSQNSIKSENISTKVPNKNSGKLNKDSAHSENDSSESKKSKKSENVSTKIPSNSTKLGNGSEKDASNQPKFVSIKFTATENAQILGKAPISEKKISNTSESDDDSDSSWTGSSASISPEKTTKKTPTTGSQEKNGESDNESDSNHNKKPVKNLEKDKSDMNMKNNDGTSTKKILTPKAKAKPTEESSGSDDDSSDSSASLKRPLTQHPKDSAKSKNGVDMKNNNDGTASAKKLTPEAKAKPAEESSGSDDDSSDSSASLKRPLTQLPKDATTSKNGVNVSPPSNDESDIANLSARSASKEKSPSVLPKKNNNISLLKTKSVTKTPSKSSRPPQPAVTPRSRKAAVDESKNKVASWLMANDASGSGAGEEASSSEEEKPEAPAQKSKKGTKKSRKNKTSNEEKPPANGEKAGTMVQGGDDTNTGGDEDDKEDGKRLVSPPRVTRQSQKRKLNENTRNGTGGQPVSKNTKKNNKKGKKRANKKNQANSGSNQEKQDTSETDKNPAEEPMPKSQEISKRKATPLTLPKKSKGLSALLEDDTDDDFQNSQPIKKPKLTPSWLDREKPTGFLTPATSVERKSDKSGTRSKKRVVKKISSSQPNRTTELNVSEKEFLSSGGVNLETLLDDENIQW